MEETPFALVPRNAEAAGSNPAGTIFKVERSNIFNSFDFQSKRAGSIPALENTSVWLAV